MPSTNGTFANKGAQLQYEKASQVVTQAGAKGALKSTGAQLALAAATAQVSQAAEKGSYAQVQAYARVEAAQLSLHDKQLALKQDQDAISESLAALDKRTKGAAQAYTETLPGQLKVLDAELQHLGITFGEWLTPKLEEAGKDLESVFSWLQKNKGAAEALGIAVGGALTLAVGVFAEQKLAKLISGLGKAAGDLQKLGQGAVNVGKKIFGAGSPTTTEESTASTGAAETGPQLNEAASSLQGAGELAGRGRLRRCDSRNEPDGEQERRCGDGELQREVDEDGEETAAEAGKFVRDGDAFAGGDFDRALHEG